MKQPRRPKAFISCSLAEEDRDFVNYVVAITGRFGFQPMGTVGKYAAAPKPIWQQMRDGIRNADCVILVATPRYLSQDLHDKQKTGHTISEMLQAEIGMAIMAGRPILPFVQEGTNVGSLLPQTSQYITLKFGDLDELKSKLPIISNLFRSALTIIQQKWHGEKMENIWGAVEGILKAIGTATIIGLIIGSDEEDY